MRRSYSAAKEEASLQHRGKAAKLAGYSEETAPLSASKNIRKYNVQQAIQKHERRIEKKFDLTEDEIIERTKNLINYDILDGYEIVDGEPIMKPLDQWPRGLRDAISEIQVLQLPDGGGLAMKVKLVSRDKALALAMKIKRMGDADPADPSKQSFNTKIIINAVEGGKQKTKILLNGKPLGKREDTVSK